MPYDMLVLFNLPLPSVCVAVEIIPHDGDKDMGGEREERRTDGTTLEIK